MLLGVALLLCLVTVPLARGRLSSLGELRLRAGWLALSAIALQILIISVVPGGSDRLHAVAHLASYALLAGFAVANASFPYLWLMACGGLLNLIAIAANGGVMPADRDALAAAGLDHGSDEFANSTALDDPYLSVLGDVFWVPESWPASNVFSVGDVLLVVGAFLALHTACGSRLALPRFATPPRPRARSTAKRR
jgi:hypothetical protein